MKRVTIGEFEELCLLMVGVLNEDAYGVSVKDEIKNRTGRELNISAAHAVLRRLEEKKLLSSRMGGSTNERGGRRKRLFTLTKAGKLALDSLIEVRMSLYNQIPNITYNFSA